MFGASKLLMWFPVSVGPAKPVGDGIVWNTTPDIDEPKYTFTKRTRNAVFEAQIDEPKGVLISPQ